MRDIETASRVGELITALNGLNFGLDAQAARRSLEAEGVDAVIVVNGARLLVEVKRDVRDADAHALLARLPAHFVVVADRLSPGAKTLLEHNHAGWFDRRGELRVDLPEAGLYVTTRVDPVAEPDRSRATNPFTATGFDVAIAMLLEPTVPLAVREIARRTDNSPGRVSEIVRELRERALVNRDGTPAIPDLFTATAAAWKPRWLNLGDKPQEDGTLLLSGSIAAIWHGIPLVMTEQWPPEVYVRDNFALRRLVMTYPPDTESIFTAPARAAVCPCAYAFAVPSGQNPEFPVANHIVVALDLAQDEGRGREALDAWNPKGVARVW